MVNAALGVTGGSDVGGDDVVTGTSQMKDIVVEQETSDRPYVSSQTRQWPVPPVTR